MNFKNSMIITLLVNKFIVKFKLKKVLKLMYVFYFI